jgi:hypothetical protein
MSVCSPTFPTIRICPLTRDKRSSRRFSSPIAKISIFQNMIGTVVVHPDSTVFNSYLFPVHNQRESLQFSEEGPNASKKDSISFSICGLLDSKNEKPENRSRKSLLSRRSGELNLDWSIHFGAIFALRTLKSPREGATPKINYLYACYTNNQLFRETCEMILSQKSTFCAVLQPKIKS